MHDLDCLWVIVINHGTRKSMYVLTKLCLSCPKLHSEEVQTDILKDYDFAFCGPRRSRTSFNMFLMILKLSDQMAISTG